MIHFEYCYKCFRQCNILRILNNKPFMNYQDTTAVCSQLRQTALF